MIYKINVLNVANVKVIKIFFFMSHYRIWQIKYLLNCELNFTFFAIFNSLFFVNKLIFIFLFNIYGLLG